MSASTPRVCMIAYTTYATDARVRREAETLAAQGFSVRCLTTKNGADRRTYTLDGVEIRELSEPKYRGNSTVAYVGSYLRFLGAASMACARLLMRRQIDVVHVHNLPDFLVLAGLLPRLAGKKVVLDIHDSVPETFAAKFRGGSLVQRALRLEERLSTMVAHRVICVNHPQRDALVARGLPAAKTFISMNVPDPSVFGGASRSRSRVDGDAFNLVYHGTMAERLGVDLLIRAVALLRERIPSIRLHLWGHGDDLAGFMRLAAELGLEEHVSFRPDGVPLRDLPRELAGMDVGVVGNRASAAGELMLPVKLLEYVSLGIPAVVPRLRTIQHYFADDMVAYFEPGDASRLADAIDELFRDPERGRRQACRAGEFLRDHGWERQGPDLVRLYRDLVKH